MSKRICVFGDSIVWGSRDSIGGGWADRLKKYFQESDMDYSIYNLGVSGDNSSDLLKRFEAECEVRQPEIIIIAIGINDAQYIVTNNNQRIPLKKYESNLAEFIKISKKFTDKILFINSIKVEELKVTPIPWDENKEKYYYNKNIKKYNEKLKEFCKNNSLLEIEMFDLLKDDDLEDGLHPNSKGHEKMFQRVKDFLMENKII